MPCIPAMDFLSENADFAQACVDAGLIFIGPPAAAIRAMGSKSASKAAMAAVGVPVAPGYHGAEQSPRAAARRGRARRLSAHHQGQRRRRRQGHASGAIGGRGGRGDRIGAAPGAHGFRRRSLLMERYFPKARHVEVQVFADSHGSIVSLFDRDCSVQRRHQKIIEEAPAPGLRERCARRWRSRHHGGARGGLCGRGHRRVPARSTRSRILLHGNEYAAAGGASGHGTHHRHRSGGVAAAHRAGRAAAETAGS
jgi:3-methylcrotonyl-CoA carboxylase alpha subunit